MRLTHQTNYAIRMMMFCDANEGLSKVGEIAKFYDLPEKFLFKILQVLTANNLIETVRGRGGGIRLAQPAKDIRLGNIIRSVEENFALSECFEQGETNCPLISGCGLSQALSRALKAFFDVLNEYTLADLTNNERNIRVLLQFETLKKQPLPDKAS